MRRPPEGSEVGEMDDDGGQRGDDMKRPDIAGVVSRETVPPPTPQTDMIRPATEPMYPSAVTVTTSPTPERRVRFVNLPAVWGNVPLRNNNFTGREAHLENLHNLLAREEQAALVSGALYGMGGVGKTQLAVEYVYRYSGEYDLVWWVPGSGHEDADRLAAKLGDLPLAVEQAAVWQAETGMSVPDYL
jgi:hypothetical protein